MTLTAPTDGATVVVSKISVLGKVAPKSAALFVSGKPVPVIGGLFRTPITLRRGVTRISINATAAGFVGSSMVITVRYIPQPPPARTSPAPTSQPQPFVAHGDITPAERAGYISGCSGGAGELRASICSCVLDRMLKSGWNTNARWQSLLQSWRRSFLAKGQIVYPPAIKQAIISCAQQALSP